MKRKRPQTGVEPSSEAVLDNTLLGDVRQLIEQSRLQVAATVHSELTQLYWQIGRRIQQDVLGQERGEYGSRVVERLGEHLTAEYGRGFSRGNLFHMVRFAEVFQDEQTVYALSRQLSWTHFRTLIYLDDPLQREFYTELARLERWSVRTMQAKLRGMLYERTAIAKQPDELIRRELADLRENDAVSPDLVFRDPYLLDFLGLLALKATEPDLPP